MVKTFKISALLALLTLFLAPLARAHELPGNPQTLAAQLQQCNFDLFRAQRGGIYYAAYGNEALAEQFYPLIFREQLRRHNPLRSRRDQDLALRLAPQMVDITLNLAYADALPSRSRKEARLMAVVAALLTEVEPHVLRSVLGSEARSAERRYGIPPEALGAGILGRAMMDLYDRVAWGPKYVVDIKLPQEQGSSGWSLDGLPLSSTQFDLLVQEVSQHLQTLDAQEKAALVGGPCLHTHPEVLVAIVVHTEDGQDQQIAVEKCEERADCTNAIGRLTWWERLADLIFGQPGNSPSGGGGGGGWTDAGGNDGGGGPAGESGSEEEDPFRGAGEVTPNLPPLDDFAFDRPSCIALLEACAERFDLGRHGCHAIEIAEWIVLFGNREFSPPIGGLGCKGLNLATARRCFELAIYSLECSA